MKICRVVNKYNSDFDVNIHRGTMWGNPYTAKEYGREKAIALYKEWLYNKIRNGEIKRAHLEVLRHMRLGCTCYPKKCHGEVLADLVNRVFGDTPENTLDI